MTETRGWRRYFEATEGRPPRETLTFALDRFAVEERSAAGFAVDIGCGTGRDALHLMRAGWSVLAIDSEPSAIDGLEARAAGISAGALQTRVARFEQTDWPPADLINSSFTLPLCPREAFFDRVWPRLVSSVRPGGRFAGQLYGVLDSWAGRPGMTFLSRKEVLALLSPFESEWFREEEKDAVTPRGEGKHWHLFHIVARKL